MKFLKFHWMAFAVILAYLFVAFLTGCATTKGKEINPETTITITDNSGTITINPGLDTQSGDMDMDSVNENKNPIDAAITPAQGLADSVQALTDAKTLAKADELKAEAEEIASEVKPEPKPEDQEPPATKIATLPTTPEEQDKYGYDTKTVLLYAGEEMSYDSVWQDKFVFPKLGPDYGPTMLIVWSDGNELAVPDSSHMAMLPKPDARKFQPGGKYSGNNPKIPTMEVYAPRDTHPKFVTIFYNKG